MADEKGISTLNSGDKSEEVSSGSEEQIESSGSLVETEDLVSTLEISAPEESSSEEDAKSDEEKAAEEAEAKAAEEAKAKEEAARAEETDDKRFDKHPRFKQLNQQVVDLKKELETLKASRKESLDFDNLVDMTDEDIKKQIEENPKSFLANFARQVRHETTQELQGSLANRETEKLVTRTYESFADQNTDFNDMWDSGELKAFMDENPGHNAISAYLVLKGQNQSDDVTAQIAAAVKEAEDRIRKEFAAKKDIPVKSSRGSSRVHEMAGKNYNTPQMKEPKKFGGTTSVLAARSAARMNKS